LRGESNLKIAVVDGQGGGIGKSIVEKLRQELADNIKILALGTNSAATVLMLRAGADEGSTGENAILYNAPKVDLITGPMGIVISNSMLGELTPLMAEAISESPAKKILIPLNKCNIEIAGVKNETLPLLIDNAVEIIKGYINCSFI
jgi:NAD(P)-dependent dehydrogenase (short-subunit alcohol dehydrogenase family)